MEGTLSSIPVRDGVKEVVIGDEVKIITQAGKEYSVPFNEVSSDEGIGSYTAAVEREKAIQENRVLPAFPDVKFPLVFERLLPDWVKVYGGYAVTGDGTVIYPSKSKAMYSGAAAETLEVSAGADPLYLNSNSVDFSMERYQVVKIIFEADGKMYECYLFGKKGGT
ncbi:MAG: hypothetical protein J6T47_08525 [Lachnospiraceae bacterium]|nr:hypothetical protein [Lachnospiraceae bacterium]